MNAQEFDAFLEAKLDDIRKVLASKGAEYVPGSVEVSRFHNFEVGAALNNESIEKTLWGFLTKHIVSVSDMVKDDSLDHSLAKWDEKLGDIFNYALLLSAMVTEKHQRVENPIPKQSIFDFAPHTDPVNPNTSVSEVKKYSDNLADVHAALSGSIARGKIQKVEQTEVKNGTVDVTEVTFPKNDDVTEEHKQWLKSHTPPRDSQPTH